MNNSNNSNDFKTCSRCKQEKSLDEFYNYARSIDGKQAYCISCSKEAISKWQQDHHEYYLQYLKTWQKQHPENMYKNWRRFQTNHPEVASAYVALNSSVASGELIKPTTCSECGKPYPSKYIHGHHSDYSQPLEVQWVCVWCHQALHQKLHENSSDFNINKLASDEYNTSEAII